MQKGTEAVCSQQSRNVMAERRRFDETKITDAIFKAARAVGGEDRQTAMELTIEVLKLLKKKYNGSRFGVEDVQDIVEKVLIEAAMPGRPRPIYYTGTNVPECGRPRVN